MRATITLPKGMPVERVSTRFKGEVYITRKFDMRLIEPGGEDFEGMPVVTGEIDTPVLGMLLMEIGSIVELQVAYNLEEGHTPFQAQLSRVA